MLKQTFVALAFCLAPIAFTQTTPDITVEHGVRMKTSDGVTLRADIYHPVGDGKYPVLLQRTPYDKNNTADFGRTAAARGYLVVVQDVRGRYTSEGEWYPFKHETDDGYDVAVWTQMAEQLGLQGLAIPEEHGGSGFGPVEQLVVLAEMGHCLVAVDNRTGGIVAWVSGADYFGRAGQVDLVRAHRSPGSALKPMIYALAFEDRTLHPESLVEDVPVRFKEWLPRNFDRGHMGTVTVRKALQQSLNVPAVLALERIGPPRFLATLRAAGASPVLAPGDNGASLGMALGNWMRTVRR